MNKRTKHNLDGLGLSTSKREELISEWVHNRRDRELLRLRLIDGLGYEDIAQRMSLSTTQTKEISYKYIDELRRYCIVSI